MFLTLATVTVLALAQEPVPAFVWHTDEAVTLPEGTLQIHDDACMGLSMERFGAFVEPRACYLVHDGASLRDALVAAFTGAGYTIADEATGEDDATTLTFSHPNRGVAEVVTILPSDGSMFVIGTQR